jgi:hypothetical protein
VSAARIEQLLRIVVEHLLLGGLTFLLKTVKTLLEEEESLGGVSQV